MKHCFATVAVLVATVATPTFAQPSAAALLAAGTFAYDKSLPLALNDSIVGSESNVAIHKISFASPRDGRVNGLLFVPAGQGPFPGVILAHGMPGNSESFRGRAIYIATHGAVVIAIDAPFNRRPGETVTFTTRDSIDQVQLMVDLQRAVDVLIARKDVDPARLGYVGRSYGGATGALFAGVERRLKTYILASADGGITTRFVGAGAETLADDGEARMRTWLASMQPIEGGRFIGLANASIFFQNGRRDPIVTASRAADLQNAFHGRKKVTWYDAEHALNAAAYVDQLVWLHEQLQISAPTAEDKAGPQIPAPPVRR